ncbi:MAG: hypothetical protein ABI877_15385 [Gemmatimonadaceae bacterium]
MPVATALRGPAGRLAMSVVLMSSLTACATLVAPDGMLLGAWGGVHLQLVADSSGGRLTYDCATGVIDLPVMVENGRLHATGTHSPGHGGPIRVGEEPVKLPARYDGELSGDKLTLTVTLTDTGQQLGVYQLRRGNPGQILACL